MHSGQFVFYQITNRFKRQFNRIVCKYNDRTKGWFFTRWNHLCVLIFAQLSGCASLRELVDIIQAHAKRSYNLGFGSLTPNRSVISKSNTLRDYRIYEEFAFYMVGQAQKRRITKEFELRGRFYAVDSTIIDLCLSVFRWAALELQNLESEFTRKLILQQRFQYSTESLMQTFMMSTPWTGLSMRSLRAMSLTVDTLIL